MRRREPSTHARQGFHTGGRFPCRLHLDIDHFKQVNDTRGHLIGSKVLIEMSKILHQHIRVTDYGFRYGGDEFILILVGSESDQAVKVAERIRKQVETSTFDVDGVKIRL